MKHIAIFASGTGSNARKIVDFFKHNSAISVEMIVSNKPDAKVLEMAQLNDIDTLVINRDYFYNSESILSELKNRSIDLVVLAGFLWLVPDYLVRAYPNRITNIHPALLPNYGGKGMYGMNVHKAVKAAGDDVSGMTIHYVNEKYDEGAIIFQASCAIDKEDGADEIAKKVLQLEHEHYAKVVYQILLEQDNKILNL